MIPSFIHDNFLLATKTGRALFHGVAAAQPIVDYHCHLSAGELADNHPFPNLTELWIAGDPYKHRAMRLAGVPEKQITGEKNARALFDTWAATVPQTLGNPLFHWTALELKRYFGIDKLLSQATAESIWQTANEQLKASSHRPRTLLAAVNVRCVCTSDGLLDDLSAHSRLSAQATNPGVLPSLRGDDIVALDPAWLTRLMGTSRDCETFLATIGERLNAFDHLGCRLADHALDRVAYEQTSDDLWKSLFERFTGTGHLTEHELLQLRSGVLRWLGREYARRGWILQLHLGAQRQTSSRLRQLAGPTGGYASIGGTIDIESLVRFLDGLERACALPRVILYPLNPADYPAIATLTGSFAGDHLPGKVQFGPAWWYNDHQWGILQQLEAQAQYGLLSVFIGMTADSRSLLSLTRHEYFRRIFCDWIGKQTEKGFLPNDSELLEDLVRRVTYTNAVEMLNLPNSADTGAKGGGVGKQKKYKT